jgi:hypothetical protein
MDGARKPVPRSPESARGLEEPPPSSRSEVPVSVTRQRRAIEPWKVLDLGKSSAPPAPVRAPVREHAKVTPRRDYRQLAARVAYATVGLAVGAGAAWRLHRAAGWSLAPRIHTLLEGGRAFLAASVAAVVALALSLALLLAAIYGRPRSLGYLVAAVATFIVAMAFTFLALTTGGHDTVAMTREAVGLVAGALPFVPLGVAVRLLRNGWVASADREGLACESLLFATALATALGFVGIELAIGAGVARALGAGGP